MKRILPRFSMIPWHRQQGLQQIQIVRAEGPYIYSRKQKILDFTSGAMVVNLGHNNPKIKDGIFNYLDRGISYVPSNFSTPMREYLSERLCQQSGIPAQKVLYGNGGADANEMASFLSKEYHYYQGNPKSRILSFQKSFHGGSTLGASLLSGDARREEKKKYYSLPLEPIMPNPEKIDGGKSSLQVIDKQLEDNVSAIVVEGSSGSAGCILYPPHYLSKLSRMCQQRNILLICDEVMSGFGRTGYFFAFQKHGLKPDIITCAKALTCGYSQLSAVIISDKVSEVFEENPVMCGLTYSGHPLGCSIANSCLDLYLENESQVIRGVEDKKEVIKTRAENICIDNKIVKDFRYNGLLSCLEFNLEEPELVDLSKKLVDHGVYNLRIRNNIFISPPLNTPVDILQEGMDIMEDTINNFQVKN